MIEIIKHIAREVLITLQIDLTKNIEYDRYTRAIIKKYVGQQSNCIDVGCHKGEILDLILKNAPNGQHFAFEPIPHLYEHLKQKYGHTTKILPYALSDTKGFTTFQYVKNAPAYSGIKKRQYDISNPVIEELEVELKTLDELISPDQQIHFIKIDVEGGEFGVLKGATNLLKRDRPIIIFEFGKGAGDYYGTQPKELYQFLTKEVGLKMYTLKSYMKTKEALTESDLEHLFDTNEEYYFIAH